VGLILDTSVVIASERLGLTAYQMLEGIGFRNNDPEVAVSVVTLLELAHGIARARRSGGRAARSLSTI
jgi:predicted nucleic acid-binding protein